LNIIWRWADPNVSNFDIVCTLGHHKKIIVGGFD